MVDIVQVLQREDNRIDPVVLALADLIADQPDRLLPHIHFEGDYCLACDWRRLDLKESAEVMPAISKQASSHLSRCLFIQDAVPYQVCILMWKTYRARVFRVS